MRPAPRGKADHEGDHLEVSRLAGAAGPLPRRPLLDHSRTGSPGAFLPTGMERREGAEHEDRRAAEEEVVRAEAAHDEPSGRAVMPRGSSRPDEPKMRLPAGS